MIPTPWKAATVYLFDSEPEWQSSVRGDFEFHVATETGLSNRETRRPMWRTVRTSLSFKTVVDWAAASRFVAGLRSWQTEQVAVPFWPAAVRWVDRDAALITSKLRIVFASDLSTWELFESVEPSWPTDDALVFPVLLGRITRNDPTWLTPTICRFAVEFEETSTSDHALSLLVGMVATTDLCPNEITVATRPSGCMGWGYLVAPHLNGGEVAMARFVITENPGLRGHLRGMWMLAHRTDAYADGVTIAGTGPSAGRTFLVIHVRVAGMGATDPSCLLALETSDTVP